MFCAMLFTSNCYVIFKFWVWEFDSSIEIFFPFILIIDLLGSMSVILQLALFVTDLFMFTFLCLLVFFELGKYVKLFISPSLIGYTFFYYFYLCVWCVCVCVYHIDGTYFKASVGFTTLPSHCWGDCWSCYQEELFNGHFRDLYFRERICGLMPLVKWLILSFSW